MAPQYLSANNIKVLRNTLEMGKCCDPIRPFQKTILTTRKKRSVGISMDYEIV